MSHDILELASPTLEFAYLHYMSLIESPNFIYVSICK